MLAFAAISVGLYVYNALTLEPPYNNVDLFLYGVLTIVLIIFFSLGISQWEDLLVKRSIKLITALAFLGVSALFGVSLVSRGRSAIIFYMIVFDGYGALLYFSGKRRWGILYTLVFIAVSGASYLLLWGTKEGGIALLNDLPWYALGIICVEFLMRYWIQRDQLEKTTSQLADAHSELQEYTHKAEELAVMQERNRLAREIHDTLGHTLTALDIQTELMARLPASRETERLQAQTQARHLVKSGLSDVRRVVEALHPSALESLSLPEAITVMIEEFESTTQIDTRWQISGKKLPLPMQYALPLYRVAQESLTNIQRHAPDTPQVTLKLAYSPASVTLTVENATTPLPDSTADEAAGGFGLRGLRQRAEALGGSFHAGPTEDGGFRVCAELPLPGDH